VKNAKIVLVSEWDGWCGACAAERPLVLTRTGRQRLRTWLTGAADDSRPLLLTCRLCGTGVDVPLERDDPPVVVTAQEPPLVPSQRTPLPEADVVEVLPAAPAPVRPSAAAAELTAGRQAVAQALGRLLAERTAAAVAPTVPLPVPVPVPVPVVAPSIAPALPLQRTAANAGLTELQLLADGIDLLSSGRG
jgi:hypothetical protein